MGESDGSSIPHAFGKGDALVFVSHKPHHVQPVKTGQRETLIMELWEGEDRRCNHRCPTHFGKCPWEAAGATSSAWETPSASSQSVEVTRTMVEQEASGVFAATAFEGNAFFARIARIMCQSDALRRVR